MPTCAKRRVLKIPVLLYHHVGPSPAGGRASLSLHQDRLEWQLDYLRRAGFTTLTLGQAFAERARERCVVLTFDDGYRDIATYALPLIAARKMVASVFVVTKLLGRTDEWNSVLGGNPLELMTPGDVRTWSRAGIEFGAHGRTHPALTALDDAALTDEIEGSRADLAALLGAVPSAFAYPFGIHDRRVRAAVSRFFPLAAGITGGMNGTSTDRLDLKRMLITNGDRRADFVLMLRLGRSVYRDFRHHAVAFRSRVRALTSPTVDA